MTNMMSDLSSLSSEESNDNLFDRSDDTVVANGDTNVNEIKNLKAELIALKMFVTEQFYLIKQQVGNPNRTVDSNYNDNYIKLLNDQLDYLKEENKAKNSIIESIVKNSPKNTMNEPFENSSILPNFAKINQENSNNSNSNIISFSTNIGGNNQHKDDNSNRSSVTDNENNDNDNGKDIKNNDDNNNDNNDNNLNFSNINNKNITSRSSKRRFNKNKDNNNNNNNDNSKNKNTDNNNSPSKEYNSLGSSRNNSHNNNSNSRTERNQQKVFILGDSMVKNVNGFFLTKNIKHRFLVKVRSFSSAKVSCMNDHAKPTMRDFDPEHIILHVGTNDLNSERTASQIANSVITLATTLKNDNNKIHISLIVPRFDNLNNKVNEVNNRLINMCQERNINFINHTNTIDPKRHLNESHLHLNRYGTNEFTKNFANFLCNMK